MAAAALRIVAPEVCGRSLRVTAQMTSALTVGDPALLERVVGNLVENALFEPFHRGGVARTAREGAGLGLSIVRAVVAAHAGTVHAEPVPGGGLAVTVHLPAG